MRLLVISAAFPPRQAGEADHALHLCERLASRGLDVHVLTTKRPAVSTQLPFKIHSIMPGWSWRDLPRFVSLLRDCAPEAALLIYTDRDYDSHPMITFAPTIFKQLFRSAPFVTQFEADYFSRKCSFGTRATLKTAAWLLGPRHLDYTYGTLLCKSDHFITLSERHMANLPNSSSIDGKGLVIPPPPLMRICSEVSEESRQHTRAVLGIPDDDFVLAYYGYVYAEKGIETLLKALQIIISRKCKARLVMIGGGQGEAHSSAYLASVHTLARDLRIQDRIIWTGAYSSDSDQASRYLWAADACVFPFKHGVTLNRSSVSAAAAHGLPIVTTKGPSLEGAFRDGENVLLCEPENPMALASAVDSLMENCQLRHVLRVGAIKLAEEYFSWDKAVNQTIVALNA